MDTFIKISPEQVLVTRGNDSIKYLSITPDEAPQVVNPIDDIDTLQSDMSITIDLDSVFSGNGNAYSVTAGQTYASVNGSILTINRQDVVSTSVTVRATNALGNVEDTFALVVNAEQSIGVIGTIPNQTVYQGSPEIEIDAAAVFSGSNLIYQVTGGGAIIDQVGLLTLTTETIRAAETVTVIASNPAAESVNTSFTFTVEVPDASFPAELANGDWSSVEVRDEAPEGRRDLQIGNITIPVGFELGWYSGIQSGLTNTAWRTIVYANEDRKTVGVMAVGEECYTQLFWRRISDGAWAPASELRNYTILGLDTGDAQPGVPRQTFSQYGMTFNLQDARPSGQYHNGDWWVKASASEPVEITSITPAGELRNDLPYIIDYNVTRPTPTGRKVHGTVLDLGKGGGSSGDENNPSGPSYGGPQGFDNMWNTESGHAQEYQNALNVDPGNTGSPIVLTGEASVCKSISLTGSSETGAWHFQGRPVLRDMAVLTVVANNPPDGAFRPATSAANKTAPAVITDVDFSFFRNLTPVDGQPTLSSVLPEIERPYNHDCTTGEKQNVYPRDNMESPGRAVDRHTGDAALLMCCDIPAADKKLLAEAICQLGLDVFDAYKDGRMWIADGQLNYGRYVPLVLAALMLDNAEMKAAADATQGRKNSHKWPYQIARRFAEVDSTFYVTQSIIDGPNNEGPGYPQSMLGKPEWGIHYGSDRQSANYSLGARYRNGSLWGKYATGLALQLTPGAREAVNHQAMFDYLDRVKDWAFTQDAEPNKPRQWHINMWNAYRSLGGPIWSG